ncbi:MAG: hypothetical protein NZ730_06625 [Porticoccaceae bacterium]|nr:hypothetical protein [Porticoccaceae bacterium]
MTNAKWQKLDRMAVGIDVAIALNKESYLKEINTHHYWENSKHKNAEKWSALHHSTAYEIQQTIIRIFGKMHEEYISSKFAEIRILESDLYADSVIRQIAEA